MGKNAHRKSMTNYDYCFSSPEENRGLEEEEHVQFFLPMNFHHGSWQSGALVIKLEK